MVQQRVAGEKRGSREQRQEQRSFRAAWRPFPSTREPGGFLDGSTSLPGHGVSGKLRGGESWIPSNPDARTKTPIRRLSPSRQAGSDYPEQATILVVRRGWGILHATHFASQPESATPARPRRFAPAFGAASK